MILNLKLIEKSLNWGAKDPRSGKIMSKFNECSDTYTIGIDKDSGSLRTGFSDNDSDAKDKSAKHRRELEKKLSMKEGTLYASSDYWSSFFIKIPSKGIKIDTSNPLGELRHTVLSADPTVVTSVEELETNGNALYSMISSEKVSESKNKKRSLLVEAATAFGKLSQDKVIDVLFLYGVNASSTSPEKNREDLGDYMESNPTMFLSKVSDPDLDLKVNILKGIKNGTLTKSGISAQDSYIKYNTIDLGLGIDEACSFLKNTENQEIYLNIQKGIKK